MWGFLALVSLAIVGIQFVKEKAAPAAPKGQRYDWDAYWEDVGNGMPIEEQIKKSKRGGYNTTEPKKEWYELPIETVVDQDRYEFDKEKFGDWYVEMNRKKGSYRVKWPKQQYRF